MSIFTKPISEVILDDLTELLQERTVESVRLGFEREIPDKEQALRKLSALANSFGGYLLVGAESDKKGRLVALPGVEPQTGYRAMLVEWCAGGVAPPLSIHVAEPINLEEENDRVLYVIYVPESELAPHFLNGKEGPLVQTAELRRPFEQRVATEYELHRLLDRRGLIKERRAALLERTHERFAQFGKLQCDRDLEGIKPLPVFFTISILPQYPAQPLVEHATLLSLLQQVSVGWRGVGFPRHAETLSQHESAIVLRPGSLWSMLEANIWGMLSYATLVAEEREAFRGIHTNQFVGYLLVFLEHARRITASLKLPTSIYLEVVMRGMRGVPWVFFPRSSAGRGPESKLDDSVIFTKTTKADVIAHSRDDLAKEVLRLLLFATNWPGASDTLDTLICMGYEFNRWGLPSITMK